MESRISSVFGLNEVPKIVIFFDSRIPNFSLDNGVVGKPIKKRTNYILAVNPWFDWDSQNKCWIQNEFYGEKHPLDMIVDGDVINGLELI